MEKCPKCQHEMIEKYWGGGDIRVVCEKCGYYELRRQGYAKQQHDVNVSDRAG